MVTNFIFQKAKLASLFWRFAANCGYKLYFVITTARPAGINKMRLAAGRPALAGCAPLPGRCCGARGATRPATAGKMPHFAKQIPDL